MYGRYQDERLQRYVEEVGQRVAAGSDRPDLKFTFTVLDTDDVNAHAAPGGYVYVNRGLLAYLRSEDELASVLGHEIAHVTAKHISSRQAGATAAGVGSALIGILTGRPDLMGVADLAGGLLVSSYSREQEMEADELGAKFIGRAGYSPGATVESLQMMHNLELFGLQRAREENRSLAGTGDSMASHPDTAKRIQEAQQQLGTATPAEPTAGDTYLSRIDGLTFGSSQNEGVVRGSRFYHAGMGITLAFPSGWSVDNQRTKVVGYSPARDALIEVTAQPIPPNMSPKEFLGRLLQGQPVTKSEPLEANGLDGHRANLRSIGLLWGNQGPASIAVVYYNGLAYVFLGESRLAAGFASLEPVFVSSVKTFRRLRDNEFAAAEPDRIRVVDIAPGATIEQIAAGSPIGKYAAEELRLLNGLYPNKQPTPGQKLKIVD